MLSTATRLKHVANCLLGTVTYVKGCSIIALQHARFPLSRNDNISNILCAMNPKKPDKLNELVHSQEHNAV